MDESTSFSLDCCFFIYLDTFIVAPLCHHRHGRAQVLIITVRVRAQF